MSYQIVHAQSGDLSVAVSDVETKVETLIDDGWELVSGVSISSLTWGSGYIYSVAQALTDEF